MFLRHRLNDDLVVGDQWTPIGQKLDSGIGRGGDATEGEGVFGGEDKSYTKTMDAAHPRNDVPLGAGIHAPQVPAYQGS